MKRLAFAAALFATMSCKTISQPEKFILNPGGEATICLKYSQAACGMMLEGCGAEHTVKMDCVTSVTYEGPTDVDPPMIYDEASPAPKPVEPEGTQGK